MLPEVTTWPAAFAAFGSALAGVYGVVTVASAYFETKRNVEVEDLKTDLNKVKVELSGVKAVATETNTLVHTLLSLHRGGDR